MADHTLYLLIPKGTTFAKLREGIVSIPPKRFYFAKNSAHLSFENHALALSAFHELRKKGHNVSWAHDDTVPQKDLNAEANWIQPTNELRFALSLEFPKSELFDILRAYPGLQSVDLKIETPMAVFVDALAAMKCKDDLNLTTNIVASFVDWQPPASASTKLSASQRSVRVSHLSPDDNVVDLRNLFAQYHGFQRLYFLDSDNIIVSFSDAVHAARGWERIKSTTIMKSVLTCDQPSLKMMPLLPVPHNVLFVRTETWLPFNEVKALFSFYAGFQKVVEGRNEKKPFYDVYFDTVEHATIVAKVIRNTTNIICNYKYQRESPSTTSNSAKPSMHLEAQVPGFMNIKAIFTSYNGFHQFVFDEHGSFHVLFDTEGNRNAALTTWRQLYRLVAAPRSCSPYHFHFSALSNKFPPSSSLYIRRPSLTRPQIYDFLENYEGFLDLRFPTNDFCVARFENEPQATTALQHLIAITNWNVNYCRVAQNRSYNQNNSSHHHTPRDHIDGLAGRASDGTTIGNSSKFDVGETEASPSKPSDATHPKSDTSRATSSSSKSTQFPWRKGVPIPESLNFHKPDSSNAAKKTSRSTGDFHRAVEDIPDFSQQAGNSSNGHGGDVGEIAAPELHSPSTDASPHGREINTPYVLTNRERQPDPITRFFAQLRQAHTRRMAGGFGSDIIQNNDSVLAVLRTVPPSRPALAGPHVQIQPSSRVRVVITDISGGLGILISSLLGAIPSGIDITPDPMFYEVLLNFVDQTGPARPPGATPDMINNLPTITYQNSEQADEKKSCVICLEDFKDGDEVNLFPNCSHHFHIQCAKPWLERNRTCPTCRADISPA